MIPGRREAARKKAHIILIYNILRITRSKKKNYLSSPSLKNSIEAAMYYEENFTQVYKKIFTRKQKETVERSKRDLQTSTTSQLATVLFSGP
jgi:hypothetical protein